MMVRALYVFFCLCLFSSCSLFKAKPKYKQENTYQEISDINSHQTPKQIAKELGKLGKKQKRAYKREQRKTRKAIKKRNLKKAKGGYYG